MANATLKAAKIMTREYGLQETCVFHAINRDITVAPINETEWKWQAELNNDGFNIINFRFDTTALGSVFVFKANQTVNPIYNNLPDDNVYRNIFTLTNGAIFAFARSGTRLKMRVLVNAVAVIDETIQYFYTNNRYWSGICLYFNDNDGYTINLLTTVSTGVGDVSSLSTNNPQTDNGHFLNDLFNGTILSDDPYDTAEEATPAGGYGDFDYTSDEIPLPNAPTISIADSGFITLYAPSLSQLQSLATYLWTGLFDVNTFKKIFANPMDCIISLALLPLAPASAGAQELKVGNVGTGISVDRLSSQFVEVNFNSLNIGRRSNSFMDYSPYTKAQIYLPFIGTRSLSIDDIAGRNIKLRYIIDLFTGACNAALGVEVEVMENGQKVRKITTLYQFTGNVLANVPVTANNFASFLQATIGAVSTAVGVATGAGALAGVASAINSATAMKPDIEKSGNLSSTAGFLGVQKPYLILTYPNLCRPESRYKVAGTPSFLSLTKNYTLTKFHGFTQVHKINVKGIPCTENERQMILTQLTGEGVILP